DETGHEAHDVASEGATVGNRRAVLEVDDADPDEALPDRLTGSAPLEEREVAERDGKRQDERRPATPDERGQDEGDDVHEDDVDEVGAEPLGEGGPRLNALHGSVRTVHGATLPAS